MITVTTVLLMMAAVGLRMLRLARDRRRRDVRVSFRLANVAHAGRTGGHVRVFARLPVAQIVRTRPPLFLSRRMQA